VKESLNIQWPRSAAQSQFPRDTVHVWAWTVDPAPHHSSESDLGLLSPTERLRMERFRFAVDQQRFRICHANLRRILAAYLGSSASALEFVTAKDGRPSLAGAHAGALDFNLSHSKTMGMLAVSSNLRVGVDIEDIRPIEWALAEKHFSAAELSSLRKLGDHWLEGFFRCWTSKEALLKAEGIGLQIPLHSFDVSVSPHDKPALLATRPASLFHTALQLFDVTPASGCCAILAASGMPTEIQRFHFDTDSASLADR
jgi:4'-phosphopantetheinyl transferase